MINKKNVLKDLMEIEYIQGYHSGRWTNEQDQNASSIYYLENIIRIADKYKLKYDKNINNYKDEDYIVEDYMGHIIKSKLENYLIQILIEDY